MTEDPIARFQEEFARAEIKETIDVNAVALATCTPDGKPSVRYVLLKGADQDGFVFYTNAESRKGRELAANPHAALAFFWPTIYVQARVEGTITKVSAEESDEYFATRARDSQLGAWASQQSRLLSSREALDHAFEDYRVRFGDGPIPRPPYWGGYCLKPTRIEFWYGKPNRLHDRHVFLREGSGWREERLYP
ncbi:MAG: pyridoxamine 5'-phosphate oxidase [Sandaracinaceae bacterium]|jgi:pyridoxamine 5'-phosphate oxidase|nr:pyridoxamine 5'-phosphate oxidase [Sandaracinaceae bacterium]